MSSQVDELGSVSGGASAPANTDAAGMDQHALEQLLTQDTHPDVIKVMITTDNHVGYMENDPVRGQDSINSFREALEIAREEKVDMILLGGDLFHENKPSRQTLHQVMAALREFTLGDAPLPLEYISDPYDNALPNYSFGAVNYEDGNFNVAIPVFAIHGNHDDPQGLGPDGALSALDILSTAGLINYFGKTNLVIGRGRPNPDDEAENDEESGGARSATRNAGGDKEIKIRPALLQKGSTKLALYGLGNLHDERLAMELRMHRVRMYQPVEDRDGYFHMLVLHQNRVSHNPKAVVPEAIFDDSLHLLVWGHEHEERGDPEPVRDKRYRICQPGSTVVTALSKGEDTPKCVCILKIHGQDYELTKRELKTVRPFIIDDLDLEDEANARGIVMDNEKSKYEISKMLENRINGLIDRAREQWQEKHADLPEDQIPAAPLPLIRLRVDYEKHEVGNLVRFGQKFVGRVANPRELLGFNKKRAQARKSKNENPFVDVDVNMDDMVIAEKLEKINLGKIVGQIIREQDLTCLPGVSLDDAVTDFVEKDAKSSILDLVNEALKRQLRSSRANAQNPAQIEDALKKAREEEEEYAQKHHGRSKSQRNAARAIVSEEEDASEEEASPEPAPAKGKVKASARRAKPAARAVSEEEELVDEEDEEQDLLSFSEEEVIPKGGSTSRGTKRSAPAPAPAKKAPAKRQAVSGSKGKDKQPIFRGYDDEGESAPIELSSDDDEDDYQPPPPAPKPAPAKTGRASVLSQFSSTAKKAPAKRAVPKDASSAPAAKRRNPSTSSPFASMASTATPASRAGARQAAKTAGSRMKKVVQADDDDFDDYDEEIED